MGTNKAEPRPQEATQSIFQQLTKSRSASHRAGTVVLPPKPPFLFFASASEVELLRGKVYLQPQKVRLEPGAMVNSKGDISKLLAYQTKIGRVLVDGDIVVTAWGQQVKGYLHRIQVGKDAGGHPVYHYHDPWTRYIRVGSETKMEFDQAGYTLFRLQLLKVLGIDEVHPAIAGPILSNKKTELARAMQAATHFPSQGIAVHELREQLEEHEE